jgi:putative DNA primase/helicase
VSEFGKVPVDLRTYRQWVTWRLQKRNGEPTKVPYNARTGVTASVTDATTWTTFAEATAAAGQYDGVGFVLTKNDPFVGIDLDHCRDAETGVIESWAEEIIAQIGSYAEASPSGRGVRMFARATLPAGGRKRGNIEIYASARFLTVTGRPLKGTPTTIEERTAELAKFHVRVFGLATAPEPSQDQRVGQVDVDDHDLLARALKSCDGDTFRRLWEGDLSVTDSDHSAADLALCNRLAFWTGRDAERIDRLFRQSRLFRSKWDRRHFADGRTYGEATIAKAIADWRPRPR